MTDVGGLFFPTYIGNIRQIALAACGDTRRLTLGKTMQRLDVVAEKADGLSRGM